MKSKNAHQEYKNVQIKTASQGQLLLMLYQGCIKFLRLSIKCIEQKDWEGANNNLHRARDIIRELIYSLNMKQGGEIAENLYSLYEFMNHKLSQANIHKDIEGVELVEKMMLKLLEAWQTIINDDSTDKRKLV